MGKEGGNEKFNWAEGLEVDTQEVSKDSVDYNQVRPLKPGAPIEGKASVDHRKGTVNPAELAAASAWKMRVGGSFAKLRGAELVDAWKAANAEGNKGIAA